MGPWSYARHLVSGPRLPFTAAYFGSIGLTLYFAIGVSPALPAHSIPLPSIPSPLSITKPRTTPSSRKKAGLHDTSGKGESCIPTPYRVRHDCLVTPSIKNPLFLLPISPCLYKASVQPSSFSRNPRVPIPRAGCHQLPEAVFRDLCVSVLLGHDRCINLPSRPHRT